MSRVALLDLTWAALFALGVTLAFVGFNWIPAILFALGFMAFAEANRLDPPRWLRRRERIRR